MTITGELRIGRIVGELLEAMGTDNGCVFLPCQKHLADLADAVLTCANAGLKFTPINVSLIAYGEETEVQQAFAKVKGFPYLYLTLGRIFDDCQKCQAERRR